MTQFTSWEIMNVLDCYFTALVELYMPKYTSDHKLNSGNADLSKKKNEGPLPRRGGNWLLQCTYIASLAKWILQTWERHNQTLSHSLLDYITWTEINKNTLHKESTFSGLTWYLDVFCVDSKEFLFEKTPIKRRKLTLEVVFSSVITTQKLDWTCNCCKL